MRYLFSLRDLQRINLSLSRAAATAPLRHIDPINPSTWEFSGFSQHGEDGIIDYLIGIMINPTGYFVEIGSGNGLENNTTWLAIARYYRGLMIDGGKENVEWCKYLLHPMNYGLDFKQIYVSKDNVPDIVRTMQTDQPDLFSLDIDGIDYYICQELLNQGVRPGIWALEYNSALGPDKIAAVRYENNFCRENESPGKLYYGCSVSAWKKLMAKNNYHFVTTDSCGVNVFFVDVNKFDKKFIENIKGQEFEENAVQRKEFGTTWNEQFDMVKNLPWEWDL